MPDGDDPINRVDVGGGVAVDDEQIAQLVGDEHPAILEAEQRSRVLGGDIRTDVDPVERMNCPNR